MLGRKKESNPVADSVFDHLGKLGRVERYVVRSLMPKVLDEIEDGETVEAAAYCASGGLAGVALGLNSRLLIVTGTKQIFNAEEFPYGDIKSVEVGQGMFRGGLIIHGEHNRAQLGGIPKDSLPAFHRWLRERVKEHRAAKPDAGPGSASSVADELAKFAALRDQGVITDEEFAAKKQDLLGL